MEKTACRYLFPVRKYLNNNHYIEKFTHQEPSNSRIWKVLHFSDIHYDPFYEVGSNADCDAPLCCLPGTKPTKPENAAGFWGDYRSCDTPLSAVDNFFKHVIEQHNDIDYVYFTGDFVDHRVWASSIEINSEVIVTITEKMKKAFRNVQVFPVLGNHEPHPVNAFADNIPEEVLSTQWVFNLVAKEWRDWLPETALETILRGGYYTILVKPGFRIIVLNNNVCFVNNWYLFYDDFDPYGQLRWLVEVLAEAERKGELVHIIAHVPTSDTSCLHNWSFEYTKIVNRFSKTIVAQFNGHTHADEKLIYFSEEDHSKAINVAFNGGSLTPYTNYNPNYIIYEVDNETYEVMDYESWTYNLTAANLRPNSDPEWYKLYSIKEAYGIKNLGPEEMFKLTEEMAKNAELAQQYIRFRYRESEPSQVKGCDKKCVLNNLCRVVRPHLGYNVHCDRFRDIIKDL